MKAHFSNFQSSCWVGKVVILFVILILISGSNLKADTKNFIVKDGVILCRKGLPQKPLWFADSRLTFAFEKPGGITRLDYYAPGKDLRPAIFSRPFHWYGFNYYLTKEGVNYNPDFQNSKVYPFGIESDWLLDGKVFKQKVMAIDESVVIQLSTPSGLPVGYHLKLDFNKLFGVVEGGHSRKWADWNFDTTENLLTGGFSESANHDSVAFSCSLGADFPVTFSQSKMNTKYYLESPLLESGKTYTFFINFGSGKNELVQKNKEWCNQQKSKIASQYARYQKVADRTPRLDSPFSELNSQMSLFPMFFEALKIENFPGAIRANTNRYWVWGWDGITNSSSTAYWGDVQHLKNMLGFYEKTADPEKGIAHSYNHDMSIGEIAPVPAQCMYITLLQLYFDQTKDVSGLTAHYPFARKIFNLALATGVNNLGMSKGVSLFPDFRVLIDETGNDLSALNNSVLYCAARSIDRLSAIVGDTATQTMAESVSNKIEKNFTRLFYDKEQKYIVSSVDATTLEQRKTYHISSLRWENDYYADLIQSLSGESLNFFEKNLICKAGIRETPVWDKSFDLDANQLSDWWPVTDESYIRLSNQNNRGDLIEKWVGWLHYWYENLTTPESVECYFNTDDPATPDRWNPGSWQAFTMRTWFQGVIHGLVGVDADAGGITFYPYNGKEMKLSGLHYLDKTFDFDMKGSGPYIGFIEVDGKKIFGTNKLPEEYYRDKKQIKITVMRTGKNPFPVSIRSTAGILLKNYSFNNGIIKTQIEGAGLTRLKISAEKVPVILIDGKQLKCDFDTSLKLATVLLKMQYNKPLLIEIKP